MVVVFVQNKAGTLRHRLLVQLDSMVGRSLGSRRAEIRRALGLKQHYHISFEDGPRFTIIGDGMRDTFRKLGIQNRSVLVARNGHNPNHGRQFGAHQRDRHPDLLLINDIQGII